MDYSCLFHLAIPVNDIQQAKAFYCQRLGCQAGRETSQALIINFYGHQVVAHQTQEPLQPQQGIYPRHFGLVFFQEEHWQHFRDRVQAQAVPFMVPPKLRFAGERTEHSTFFIADPCHNLLEFKFYRYPEAIFGQRQFAAVGDR